MYLPHKYRNESLLFIQWLILLEIFCYLIDHTFVSVLISIKTFRKMCVPWFWGYILWCNIYADLEVIINCPQNTEISNIHQIITTSNKNWKHHILPITIRSKRSTRNNIFIKWISTHSFLVILESYEYFNRVSPNKHQSIQYSC